MYFLVLLLFSLTACLLCIDTSSRLSVLGITAPFLTAFAVSWPTTYIPRPFRGILQFIIGELFIFICIIDCFCQEVFATPITPQVLSNVLLSDARETYEFISTFFAVRFFSHWRLIATVALSMMLPVSLYFGRKYESRCKWGYKPWLIVLAACIACETLPSYRFMQMFCQHRDLQKMEGLIFRHYHEEIPTPLHRFAFAWYSLKQSEHVLLNIKQSTFSAPIDSCSHRSPHIVLVIGESYNKHHSTLYGYSLPTTPLQQKRMDDGELFVFTDAVSPWNITSNVFLDIFSVWEDGMEATIGEMPLFSILFRRAGYSVHFFSNQYLLEGFRKASTNQAGHFFLADDELSDSLFDFRNSESHKYDMGLVEQVAQFKKERRRQEYTLDIIHLIGQHFSYSLRCPIEHRAFSPSDYADRSLDVGAKKIVMQYDNATHYNDIVLDSILTLYENEEAVVLFVADHGEEVYDELPVHGRLFQEPTTFQAKNEFEVPMWIWCSKSYTGKHPDVLSAIRSSTAKPFLTDGIPQMLLYLAGIHCEWSNDSRNMLSPRYQIKQRIIGGSVDYDKQREAESLPNE